MSTRVLLSAAWPYIHTVAGVHNLIPILAADVMARFHRHMEHEVFFVSGTDEFGGRTELMARSLDCDPQTLVDRNFQTLSSLLAGWYGINFSSFARTTSRYHQQFARDFYLRLKAKRHLFKAGVAVLHCPGCDRVLMDRFVEGICPNCGADGAHGDQCKECGSIMEPTKLIDPTCAICGSSPEPEVREHWLFDLPRFSAEVEGFLRETNLSAEARQYALRSLKHRQPFVVTRDQPWGIRSPLDADSPQTICSWAETILGDISAPSMLGKADEFWKDPETLSILFMGMDNVPFLSILFPALLLAADSGYVLPSRIVANHFLNFEGRVCSKSSGNGIWLDEAPLLVENPDCWRFYLMRNYPLHGGVDFRWTDFASQINDQLVSRLDAFVCSVSARLAEASTGQPAIPDGLSQADHHILHRMDETVQEVTAALDDVEIPAGLNLAMAFLDDCQAYLDALAILERRDLLPPIGLTLCHALALLLHPFMPSTSRKIWSHFGFSGEIADQSWKEGSRHLLTAALKPHAPLGRLFDKVNSEALTASFRQLRQKGPNLPTLALLGELCESWEESQMRGTRWPLPTGSICKTSAGGTT